MLKAGTTSEAGEGGGAGRGRRRRRLIRGAIPLAVLLVAAWSVAPALSLRPYVPDPVDFEQPLPRAERVEQRAGAAAAGRAARREAHHREHRSHGHHRPVRFLTPVIEAPKRFDVVGVAGEVRPLEFRVRSEGGRWSDWVETAHGDPVYTGGSNEVQVRSRGVRPTGKLHFVNVSGDQTLAAGVLTSVRRAVSSALIAVAATPLAEAEPPQPDFVSRKRWGADRKCKPRRRPSYGRVKAAVVHHTVTTNRYSRNEARSIVLAICRYHRNANGWNDIGYNALVDRFGTLYEGRDGGLRRRVIGAHAQGYNSYTTGVASIATHTRAKPRKRVKNALADYLAWKLARHGKRAKGKTRIRSGGGSVNRYPAGRRVRLPRVFDHGRANVTACPGKGMRRKLRSIRRKAQRRIDRHEDEEPIPPPAPIEDELPSGGVARPR